MRKITFTRVAALAALLLGGGLAFAPEARAGVVLNGVSFNGVGLNGVALNGVSLNGQNLNGTSSNGAMLQGRPASGEAAGVADPGALRVRAVRLPDGRTLLPQQR